jgi:hypothetical protein
MAQDIVLAQHSATWPLSFHELLPHIYVALYEEEQQQIIASSSN